MGDYIYKKQKKSTTINDSVWISGVWKIFQKHPFSNLSKIYLGMRDEKADEELNVLVYTGA